MKRQTLKRFARIILYLACLAPPIAQAQTVAQNSHNAQASSPNQLDKNQYNLFRPTPPDQMRNFAPDRPNITDGPYTVDAGHLLVEVGLFEYERDRYNNENSRLDAFAFGDTNLRIGITNHAEMDLLFTVYSYLRAKYKQTGMRSKQSGFSDLTLRSKINLYGDDAGFWAIGLIPFLTFPTARDGLGNRGFAGGVGIPVQFAIPSGFQLGVETTIQTVHEPGGGSHFDYLNSITLGHPITKKLSTYVEFASEVDTSPHESWIGTFDTGLIYQPADNWQLDTGVNIGVTKGANDLFTFIGAAWRY